VQTGGGGPEYGYLSPGMGWAVWRRKEPCGGAFAQNEWSACDVIRQTLLKLARVERPLCPKCKTQMMVARITPGQTGFELQSFDCPKCNHELTTEVPEQDPLDKLKGWLFGELGQAT
jgi:hypothetical protein